LGVAATARISGGITAGLAVPLGVLAVASPRLAFAGILGLGFVALAAHNVAAGVAAFTVVALLEQVPPVAGSPAIKLAGAVLVILLVRRQLPLLRLLREHPGLACTAVFLAAWAGASSLWAQDPDAAVASAFRLALGIVLVFVVYGAVRERQHVRWLTHAFVAGALVTSFIGAVGFTATDFESDRLVGGVGNPNELGSILVPAIALAGFRLASGPSRRSQVLIGVSLVGLFAALLLTASRGALVALAVSVVTAVIFGGIFRMHIVALVAAILGIGVGYYAFVAPPEIRDRLVNFSAEGGAGRTDVWQVARSVAADRPILGVGAGNFPIVESAYAADTINLPRIRFIVDTPKVPHNTYLGIQAELGIPGLVAFLLIVGVAIMSALRAISSAVAAGDRELEFLGRGVLVALVAVLTAATFGSYEYAKHLWLIIGLAAVMPSVVSHSARRLSARPPDQGDPSRRSSPGFLARAASSRKRVPRTTLVAHRSR
jgi:O-antigen ligase